MQLGKSVDGQRILPSTTQKDALVAMSTSTSCSGPRASGRSTCSVSTSKMLYKAPGPCSSTALKSMLISTFKGVKQFTIQAKWDLMVAHDVIIANHVQQTFHANKKCRTSDLYHVEIMCTYQHRTSQFHCCVNILFFLMMFLSVLEFIKCL